MGGENLKVRYSAKHGIMSITLIKVSAFESHPGLCFTVCLPVCFAHLYVWIMTTSVSDHPIIARPLPTTTIVLINCLPQNSKAILQIDYLFVKNESER